MKIIVKKLQGGEFSLEVSPNTSILDIKKQIAEILRVPIAQQKLLLLGRTLADDQVVQSYPNMKDGTKLNLVVKKPEGLLEVSIKHFKKQGMSDTEAVNTANRFLRIVDDKLNKLSWDDVERLCQDCLMEERGQRRPVTSEMENDCDDMSGL